MKEKIRICRSGSEKVTNDDESGESVLHVGVDLDYSWHRSRQWAPNSSASTRTFLNSYKSVVLLNDQSPGIFFGSSNGSLGCQYSTNPPSSAEIIQSYLSLYYRATGQSTNSVPPPTGEVLTVMTCTGKRWSLSTVSRGWSLPRPSYNRMVPEFRSELHHH